MKVEDYDFSPILREDVELRGFVDNVKQIMNNGRYQVRIVASAPNWTGDEGEIVAFSAGGVYRLYIYISGDWRVAALA